MLSFLEYYFRALPGFTLVQPLLERLALRSWSRRRIPPPPRSVKVSAIRRFVDPNKRRVLVETGTFYGDTIAALRNDFSRIYSIELHPRLARRARRRFAGDRHVTIIQGDSGTELQPVLRNLREPAVLWLDGHYSGVLTARGVTDTPVMRELACALRFGSPDDAILIDDARLFGVDPAYPAIAEIAALVQRERPFWGLWVEDDIIRLCSK